METSEVHAMLIESCAEHWRTQGVYIYLTFGFRTRQFGGSDVEWDIEAC